MLLVLTSVDPGPVDAAAGLGADGHLLRAGLTAAGPADAIGTVRRGELPIPPVLVRHLTTGARRAGRTPAARR